MGRRGPKRFYQGTPWDGTPPLLSVYAERHELIRERDFYRNLAQTAIRAMELLTMGIGDTKTGAARELEEARDHMAAVVANASADLAELPEALSKFATATASMAAVQSATSIQMFKTHLDVLEAHVNKMREDIADIRMLVDEILRERGAA